MSDIDIDIERLREAVERADKASWYDYGWQGEQDDLWTLIEAALWILALTDQDRVWPPKEGES